jgi:riboflavin kinase / FMN adenylyltransferase
MTRASREPPPILAPPVMELIRGIHNIRPQHHGCVATIGNFDGVHLGHSEIIKRLKRLAEGHGAASAVIIFEPQPEEFFFHDECPARLSRLREKFHLIGERGVDRLIVFKFDRALAARKPEHFVRNLLVDMLGVKAVIIGDDFRFGRARRGDFKMLLNLGRAYGFEVEQTPPFLFIGKRISSTYIRSLLHHGYMREAERMLGHPFCMEGRVVRGHQQGREWGFPTANLDLRRLESPVSGIFAVKVHGLGEQAMKGVAYVGSRPIIDDPRYVLEVHVFDYDAECYGDYIKVQFINKIREDLPFESFDVMAAQIKRDCDAAREILDFEY